MSKVYALNLFNVADQDEYLAYSHRSAREVQAHGGRVVALGRFREAVTGDIMTRSYRNDPRLADLHPHREKGAADYVWHLFDKLDDLHPLFK